MQIDKQYFKPLTGLRFIAALMVFICHLLPQVYSPFINGLIAQMQIGVPIFFVLSGFLIGHRYYDPVTGISDGTRNYFANRIVRIVPVYLVITILNCIWYQLDFKTAFLNLTLLHGFFPDYVFTPLPHTWSLTVECTFYLLVPLIFRFMKAGVDVLTQSIMFLMAGFIMTDLLGIFPVDFFWGKNSYMLLLTFFGRSFEFLVGVRLALYVKSADVNVKYSGIKTYASIIVFIGMLITLSVTGGLHTYTGMILHNLIMPVCIAFVLFGLIVSKNVISTVLSTPAFQLLGNSSYVFFLIHYGFWQKIMVNYLFTNFVLELILTVILSIILYKTLEEPLIKLTKIQLAKLRRSSSYKKFRVQMSQW